MAVAYELFRRTLSAGSTQQAVLVLHRKIDY